MQQLINLIFYHIIHLTLLAAPLLASKFYITVFSICIISLRFNFLLFVSIYCCSFFPNILQLYVLEEDAQAEERNHRFTFFARFIRFIHLFFWREFVSTPFRRATMCVMAANHILDWARARRCLLNSRAQHKSAQQHIQFLNGVIIIISNVNSKIASTHTTTTSERVTEWEISFTPRIKLRKAFYNLLLRFAPFQKKSCRVYLSWFFLSRLLCSTLFSIINKFTAMFGALTHFAVYARDIRKKNQMIFISFILRMRVSTSFI